MTGFREQDLSGARFERVSLRGATFTHVDLNSASMQAVDLTGAARIRGSSFNASRMPGVELVDVEINGELENVIVNGVDIAPLVEAECLSIVLIEEWEHRLYAERDLTALTDGS